MRLALLRTMLKQGLSARMRAHGVSMSPLIRDGDLVTVAPPAGEPRVGDVVACVLPQSGQLVIHRIVSAEGKGWLVRGDNSPASDGIVERDDILGTVVAVERNGRQIGLRNGAATAGIAWLSRTGVLRMLGVPRRLFYRALSITGRGLQSRHAYRWLGRRLGASIAVGPAGSEESRQAHEMIGRTEAGLSPHGAPSVDDSSWSARSGSRLVGFVRITVVDESHQGLGGYWLSDLWVRGRYRGLGVGEKLVAQAIARVSDRRADRLRLAVFTDDEAALCLFHKLGFVESHVVELEEGLAAEEQLYGRRRVVLSRSLSPLSRDATRWVDAPGLSEESRTVLACAASVVDVSFAATATALVEHCADTERLCAVAAAHGMIGHLHRLLSTQPGASAVLAARLGELQRLIAERDLLQTAQLLGLLEEFEAAGIKVMPYKGPVWGERFYGDLTLRSWSDLDLLVAHGQVALARQILLDKGFADHGTFTERIMAQRDRGLGEIEIWSTTSDLHLELHWAATVGVGARSLSAEYLFQRAQRTNLLDHEVMTPDKVDALLLSCLNGTKDRWTDIEGLLCVAVQIRGFAPDDWPQVLRRAKERGCLRRTLVGVAHVCRVFDLPTPSAVTAAAAGDTTVRRLLVTLSPAALEREKSGSIKPGIGMIGWRVTSEDSSLASARHVTTRFFRTGPEDWEWLTLPRGAAWLYPALRPARLVAKWVRRLVVH